jgi:hypothetical protein
MMMSPGCSPASSAASRHDLHDHCALGDGQPVLLGDAGIQRLPLDAQLRVLGVAVFDELVGDRQRGRDRDGEPDPDVPGCGR